MKECRSLGRILYLWRTLGQLRWPSTDTPVAALRTNSAYDCNTFHIQENLSWIQSNICQLLTSSCLRRKWTAVLKWGASGKTEVQHRDPQRGPLNSTKVRITGLTLWQPDGMGCLWTSLHPSKTVTSWPWSRINLASKTTRFQPSRHLTWGPHLSF